MAIKTTCNLYKMKNTYKTILALALGLTGAMTLKASSDYDVLLGFTQGGGNSGGADFIVDIGPAINSYTTGFYNGETWSLGSALSAENFNLSSVSWGAVGDVNDSSDGAATQTLWVTTPGSTPPSIPDDGRFAQADSGITTIEDDLFGGLSSENQSTTVAANNPDSWNQETVSGGLGSDFANGYANPNVAGETSATLWQVPEGGTPTAIGTLSLNSSGVVTFGAISSVPVPKITNVTRNGATTTIYFTTVGSTHSYTLYYTNSAGLLAPVGAWTKGNSTPGNNGTNSLTDTVSSPNRFYTIGVQ